MLTYSLVKISIDQIMKWLWVKTLVPRYTKKSWLLDVNSPEYGNKTGFDPFSGINPTFDALLGSSFYLINN